MMILKVISTLIMFTLLLMGFVEKPALAIKETIMDINQVRQIIGDYGVGGEDSLTDIDKITATIGFTNTTDIPDYLMAAS